MFASCLNAPKNTNVKKEEYPTMADALRDIHPGDKNPDVFMISV